MSYTNAPESLTPERAAVAATDAALKAAADELVAAREDAREHEQRARCLGDELATARRLCAGWEETCGRLLGELARLNAQLDASARHAADLEAARSPAPAADAGLALALGEERAVLARRCADLERMLERAVRERMDVSAERDRLALERDEELRTSALLRGERERIAKERDAALARVSELERELARAALAGVRS